MKKVLKIIGLILVLGIVAFLAIEGLYVPRYFIHKEPIEAKSKEGDNITVMSSNVRCFALDDLFHKSWFYRAELIRNNLSEVSPDIVGFQEVTWLHYDYLKDILPGYDSVINYRDDTLMSESCPIFYRSDRFELIDKGSFWLSETPEVMSKDWGAACYRICSYVILKEKTEGKEIVVFNTHLDHVSDEARVNGIAVVLDKIKEFGGKPAILMGDLNAEPDSETYNSAVQNFDDAQIIAPDTMDSATYQAWGSKLDEPRIDYFMVSKIGITVNKYEVLRNTYDGTYPSDHFPIYIHISLQ